MSTFHQTWKNRSVSDGVEIYLQKHNADEPEAMFPDSKYAFIRSNRHIVPAEIPPKSCSTVEMDLYKLRLYGTGKEV